MSRTNIYTAKGKFNNDVLYDIPVSLQLHWDRWNDNKGHYRGKHKKIKQQCFDTECVKELQPYYYDTEDWVDNLIE